MTLTELSAKIASVIAGKAKTKLDAKQDKLTVAGAANKGIYVSASGVVSAMTHTLDADVPSNAVFTDTTYAPATTAAGGLMSAADKAKLDAIKALLQNAVLDRIASGNPATFSDGKAANLKALTVTIAPTQSGSGDPSPSNVRPITGVSSVKATRTGESGANPQSVTVALTDGANPLTVYGGTLDVTTGTLTVTHGFLTENSFSTMTGGTNAKGLKYLDYSTSIGDGGILCNMLKYIPNPDNAWYSEGANVTVARFTNSTKIRVYVTQTSLVDFQTAYAGLQVVYPLASPLTYQLTPQQLSALAGYNSVSADAGTLSVTYLSDPSIALGGGT